MQMVELAHTKLMRQYRIFPANVKLMESEQQLEFIFMVKERVFMNEDRYDENNRNDLKWLLHLREFLDQRKVFSEAERTAIVSHWNSKIRGYPLVDFFADSESHKAYFTRVSELFTQNLGEAYVKQLDLSDYVNSLLDLEFVSLFEYSSDNYLVILLQLKDQLISLIEDLNNA